MGVSKNRGGPPKSSHLFIGFSMKFFTIHSGGKPTPYFLGSTPIHIYIYIYVIYIYKSMFFDQFGKAIVLHENFRVGLKKQDSGPNQRLHPPKKKRGLTR